MFGIFYGLKTPPPFLSSWALLVLVEMGWLSVAWESISDKYLRVFLTRTCTSCQTFRLKTLVNNFSRAALAESWLDALCWQMSFGQRNTWERLHDSPGKQTGVIQFQGWHSEGNKEAIFWRQIMALIFSDVWATVGWMEYLCFSDEEWRPDAGLGWCQLQFLEFRSGTWNELQWGVWKIGCSRRQSGDQ